MALAAILALVTPKPAIAHIIHDLRPSEVTNLDREAVTKLAEGLGCSYIERAIHIKDQPGNAEHNARTGRYECLAEIAKEHGIDYIATGHHADDQLETMLMNLSRGSGPRGLAGIHESRPYQGITIIRPMLCITHQNALDICNLANIQFTYDHTNDDQSLTRNRLRHRLLPECRAFDPDIATRASTGAESIRSMVNAFDQMVLDHIWPKAALQEQSITWTRTSLREQLDAVIYVILRQCVIHLSQGRGLDQITNQSVTDIIRVITDSSTEPRTSRLGPIVVAVTANHITMTLFRTGNES